MSVGKWKFVRAYVKFEVIIVVYSYTFATFILAGVGVKLRPLEKLKDL